MSDELHEDANLPKELMSSYVYAGDAWRYPEIYFEDGDTETPFDLTDGFSGWRAQFRPSPGSAHVVELMVDDSAAAQGVLVVSAGPDATRAMGGDGRWDLQALDGRGVPITFVWSRIKWIQDVTR